MRRGRSHSRAFFSLLVFGLIVEGLSAWLAWDWAAQVLPCRLHPAQAVFGPSDACPIPIALVGRDTFVPALLLASLVVSSVVVFLLSFGSVVLATFRARQACARHRVPLPSPFPIEAVVPNARRAKWLVVVGDDSLSAYCIGLLRPWVVVSSRLLEELSEPGLRAVLEHETSHCHRHDPLRAALAGSLARALFFVPSLGDLAKATLAENEISADARAV